MYVILIISIERDVWPFLWCTDVLMCAWLPECITIIRFIPGLCYWLWSLWMLQTLNVNLSNTLLPNNIFTLVIELFIYIFLCVSLLFIFPLIPQTPFPASLPWCRSLTLEIPYILDTCTSGLCHTERCHFCIIVMCVGWFGPLERTSSFDGVTIGGMG